MLAARHDDDDDDDIFARGFSPKENVIGRLVFKLTTIPLSSRYWRFVEKYVELKSFGGCRFNHDFK